VFYWGRWLATSRLGRGGAVEEPSEANRSRSLCFFFQEAGWLRELGGEAEGGRGGTLKTVDVSSFIFLGVEI